MQFSFTRMVMSSYLAIELTYLTLCTMSAIANKLRMPWVIHRKGNNPNVSKNPIVSHPHKIKQRTRPELCALISKSTEQHSNAYRALANGKIYCQRPGRYPQGIGQSIEQ